MAQMEAAFEAGYDPALELASHAKKAAGDKQVQSSVENLESDIAESWTHHLRRKEQDIIDQIIAGAETGHYYVLLGAKVSPALLPSRLKIIHAFTREREKPP